MENEKSKVVKVGINKLIIPKLFSYEQHKLDLVEEEDDINKLKDSQKILIRVAPVIYGSHVAQIPRFCYSIYKLYSA